MVYINSWNIITSKLLVIQLLIYSYSPKNTINYNKLPNRNLLNFFVECSKEGHCQRKDKVLLQLGWVPRVPVKTTDEIFDIEDRTIISLNPFTNTTSLLFLRGSEKHTCADGVSECFNSCCRKGSCSDPSNICTIALKSSKTIIYVCCIIWALFVIAYWVIFGYIGVKYSKKKATVMIVTGDSQVSRSNEHLLQSNLISLDQTNRSNFLGVNSGLGANAMSGVDMKGYDSRGDMSINSKILPNNVKGKRTVTKKKRQDKSEDKPSEADIQSSSQAHSKPIESNTERTNPESKQIEMKEASVNVFKSYDKDSQIKNNDEPIDKPESKEDDKKDKSMSDDGFEVRDLDNYGEIV